jgi:hypothetical protein
MKIHYPVISGSAESMRSDPVVGSVWAGERIVIVWFRWGSAERRPRIWSTYRAVHIAIGGKYREI